MPIGPYEDFDECVRENQDKDDPEAYCASLEQRGAIMIDWSGLILIEGELTGDGRIFEEGSIRWAELPMPLKLSHDIDAPVVGNVTEITRDGNRIFARGTIDDSTTDGMEAIRRLDDTTHEAFAAGVSVEIDEMEAEVRVSPEMMGDMDEPPETEIADDGKVVVWKMGPEQEVLVVTDARVRALALATVAAFVDAKITLLNALSAAMAKIAQIVDDLRTPDGEDDLTGISVAPLDTAWDEVTARENTIAHATREDGTLDEAELSEYFLIVDPDGDPQDPATYQLGYTDVFATEEDDECMIVPNGVSALPVAAEEMLMDAGDAERTAVQDRICGLYDTVRAVHADFAECPYAEPVVAGGGTVYPAALFDNPDLSAPQGVLVAEVNGLRHLVGHLALWNTCHTAFDGHCVMPPVSQSSYNRFHLHSVETDRGPLPVGKITVNTTHARRQANSMETIRHYEDTGVQAAIIRVGEDEHGIWVAGVIPAHISDDDARALLEGSPLSGDWRWDAKTKNLELRGVLAVNIPGFPVPRYAMSASGLPASVQVGYDARLERAIDTFRIAEAEAEMAGV